MTYRLFIDIELGDDQKSAISKANGMMGELHQLFSQWGNPEAYNIVTYNWRLGNDNDRQQKDYLRINENGHAANGKQKLKMT